MGGWCADSRRYSMEGGAVQPGSVITLQGRESGGTLALINFTVVTLSELLFIFLSPENKKTV